MDTKHLEVVQLIERRRKWPVDVKARIVEEALAPGVTIASVADRHGTCQAGKAAPITSRLLSLEG